MFPAGFGTIPAQDFGRGFYGIKYLRVAAVVLATLLWGRGRGLLAGLSLLDDVYEGREREGGREGGRGERGSGEGEREREREGGRKRGKRER